jgi:hypothetical protein
MFIQTISPQQALSTVEAASTAIGMRGWTEAVTQNMTLAVEIKNVQFVLSQIILPDVISVAVISTAAGSDISIMTSSIRCFSTEIDSKTGNALTAPQSVLSPDEYQGGICKCPVNWLPRSETALGLPYGLLWQDRDWDETRWNWGDRAVKGGGRQYPVCPYCHPPGIASQSCMVHA